MPDYTLSPHKADDVDSDSSDAIIELHSTESDEHRLTNQVHEALSAYSDMQKLVYSLRGIIQQAVACYDVKLYVILHTCVRCNIVIVIIL